ncbi:MAG TPA: LamG-like jellyroll fold domain-containing protein [Sedimentisphaerales bacterium]|nr:LamG-like jellyroll fold domain-containing protein [Sedimentisphaerales bacterium]
MCRNLIYLFSFVLVPGIVLTNSANAELVGWWRFNEGSGSTCNDSSGNGHDGTVLGTPEWASGPEGFGPALVFNPEICQGVDCGIFDPTNGTGQFTLALWAFWDGTGTYQHFLTKSNGWGADTMMFQVELWGAHETSTYTDRVGISYASAGSVPFSIMPKNEWVHLALTFDGSNAILYLNGIDEEGPKPLSIGPNVNAPVFIGVSHAAEGRVFHGSLDEVRIYSHALSESEVLAAMQGSEGYPYALGPNPADGTLLTDTWATLGWSPGDFAVSHDVYIGDNFDDVNEATRDSDLFRINQDLDSTFYVAGLLGYPYPDGLVPGTTYYWRIDEVNEAEPNSPWKGDVWSFMVPPKTAYYPDPANGAELVPENATLTWTAGFGAKMHTVYFGEDFDTVNEAAGGTSIGVTSYTPSQLKLAKTYYWRVDEFDGDATYKGDVWSFTTEGAVTGPNPADGAVDVKPTRILSWDAGAIAASHEVYFGADADAVKNATKTSPEYKGAKALGEESYDPGKLALTTTYYWRIDEVNGVNPDSPWAGNVWSFTTGDFFVIDDFEDYDAGDNQIWCAWHDGLGYGTPGTADYFAGNGTGAAVGDENTASYTEETIVNGGLQSMPLVFDNNKQGFSKYSEVELTLSAVRDWTAEGVAELSLWFRGYPASVGSFVEAPAGTYTMTASGADIWAVNGVEADEFHFAYKTLSGTGSIVARVQSVENTNAWAKAGVMIRETLDADSAHAFACITPANGVASQGRPDTGAASFNYAQSGITAPYWVKLERSISGLFTVSHSANGSTWQPVTGATPQNIPMGSNVYIGLAVTAHDAALTCEAVFSNVTTTGTVGPQWAHQDIGIASNAAELLYVAISNSAGTLAVVIHDDPAATQIDTWTEWIIPLQAFADQGINLTNVDRIAIGLGTKGNITVPGGSGKMYFDDIRLNRPKEAAAE